jgi:surface antigen
MKGVQMDEQTKKQLEEAHKKAMEGLKAFNDAAKETIDYGKKSIGL